jgi:gliding motility-associated-like protein
MQRVIYILALFICMGFGSRSQNNILRSPDRGSHKPSHASDCSLQINSVPPICAGTSVTLQAIGADSYTWNQGTTGSTLAISPSLTTSYTVTASYFSACSSTYAVITVSVLPKPLVTLNSASICPGSSVLLSPNTTPASGIAYLWQPGGANTSNLLVSPASTSVYTLTVSLNTCSTIATGTVTVQYTSTAVSGFTYAPLCTQGENALPFKDPGFSENGFFIADPPLFADINSGSIDLSASPQGTYIVTYSVPAQSCMAGNNSTAEVFIQHAPELDISPDLQIGPGTSTTLHVSGASSYTWGGDATISCTDCSSPKVSPANTTRYCVQAEDSGCTVKACVTVKVGCDHGDLSLPNAFSPNGDGHNDNFCLQGWDLCVHYFSILIFNRWGEKVFESDKADFCWDGTYNGKMLESDVLVYTITASFPNNNRIDKKGNITLLR